MFYAIQAGLKFTTWPRKSLNPNLTALASQLEITGPCYHWPLLCFVKTLLRTSLVIFGWRMFSLLSLMWYLEGELLGHMVTLRLNFWQTVNVPFWVAPLSTPLAMCMTVSLCPLLFYFFNDSLPRGCEWALAHCSCDLHSPSVRCCASFHIRWLLTHPSWRNVYLILFPFRNWGWIFFLNVICVQSPYQIHDLRKHPFRISPACPSSPGDKLQVTYLDFVRWLINFL